PSARKEQPLSSSTLVRARTQIPQARRARAWMPVGVAEVPTAKTDPEDRASSPLSSLESSAAPALGAATLDQAPVVRCRSRLRKLCVFRLSKRPTAHASVDDTRSTPRRSLSEAPTFGLGTRVHA